MPVQHSGGRKEAKVKVREVGVEGAFASMKMSGASSVRGSGKDPGKKSPQWPAPGTLTPGRGRLKGPGV